MVFESSATVTSVLKIVLHHWNWLPVWNSTGWKKLYQSASRATVSVPVPPAVEGAADAAVEAGGAADAAVDGGAADAPLDAAGVLLQAPAINIAAASRLK